MYQGQTVFTQIMNHLPKYSFTKYVNKYKGNYKVQSFHCWEQFLVMSFAQLTYRESLRDIESCLRAMNKKLYHMGISSKISRSTLATANKKRDWRIYHDFAMVLIKRAKDLYKNENLFEELDQTVYALDSSTIDLCLTLFPWAKYKKTKSAIKLHTLLDLQNNIPSFIYITDGSVHDVNILDILVAEVGAYYVMDKGYIDFQRLYNLNQGNAYFVTRAKTNMKFRRLYSNKVDKTTGVLCDQIILLTTPKTKEKYPDKLRRIKYFNSEINKKFVFITNNFSLPSTTIANLYKQRWQIEMTFRGMKSSGFDIEKTHLSDTKRIEKLILLVMIAFVWAYKVGIYIHQNIKQIIVKKHGRKAKTIFKTGLDYITNYFLNSKYKANIDIFKFLSCT